MLLSLYPIPISTLLSRTCPGSSRIGNKLWLRAHLALESKFISRLIYGLENAVISLPNSDLNPFEPHLSRLISHWKQTLAAGSPRIGIKVHFQAHLRIGKCCYLFTQFRASAGPVEGYSLNNRKLVTSLGRDQTICLDDNGKQRRSPPA